VLLGGALHARALSIAHLAAIFGARRARARVLPVAYAHVAGANRARAVGSGAVRRQLAIARRGGAVVFEQALVVDDARSPQPGRGPRQQRQTPARPHAPRVPTPAGQKKGPAAGGSAAGKRNGSESLVRQELAGHCTV